MADPVIDWAGRDAEPIACLIRRARLERGLTQAGLAAALAAASGNRSIAREHVARWERGRHIPGRYWRSWLATVLRLSAHEVDRAVLARRLHRLYEQQGITSNDP